MIDPNYEYEDLVNKTVRFKVVNIQERPDEVWVKLDEGVPADKYVWRFDETKINDDGLLEFELECLNLDGGSLDEVYPYAAAMLVRSLKEAIDEKKAQSEPVTD